MKKYEAHEPSKVVKNGVHAKKKNKGLRGPYPLSDLRDSHEERHGGTGAGVTTYSMTELH